MYKLLRVSAMRRRRFFSVFGAVAMAAAPHLNLCAAEAPSAGKSTGKSRRARRGERLVTDEELDASIKAGVAAVLSMQQRDGSWEGWATSPDLEHEGLPLTPDGERTWPLSGSDIASTSYATLALLRASSGKLPPEGLILDAIQRATMSLVKAVEVCPDRPGAWLGSRLSADRARLLYGFSGALGTTITTYCLRRLVHCWPTDDKQFGDRLAKAVTKALNLLVGIQSDEGEWNLVASTLKRDLDGSVTLASATTAGQETIIGCQALEVPFAPGQYSGDIKPGKEHWARLDRARQFITASQRLNVYRTTWLPLVIRARCPVARAAHELCREADRDDARPSDVIPTVDRLRQLGILPEAATYLVDSWQFYHRALGRRGEAFRIPEQLFGRPTQSERAAMHIHHYLDALTCWSDDERDLEVREIESRFVRAQQADGSWTSFGGVPLPRQETFAHPSICTSNALLSLTAERDRPWLQSVVAAEKARFLP